MLRVVLSFCAVQLFHFVCAVADLLTDRNAWDEVLPHGKRALELAPRHGIADAVNSYAQALFQLGNCTEAEKVHTAERLMRGPGIPRR